VFLAGVAVTLMYYVLLAGALFGTLFLWRTSDDSRQRLFVAVAWLYMAAAMPTALTLVGKRFRVAMIDPYLVIVACAALTEWLRRRRHAEAGSAGQPGPARDAPGGPALPEAATRGR